MGCRKQVIAVHPRCWERERQSPRRPLHYLPLLERKAGGLDHALPLKGWVLPGCFEALRRRLESEREDGTREYIRVLRLLEKHPPETVEAAVEKGLRMRACPANAIMSHLNTNANMSHPMTIGSSEPWERATFRLDGREAAAAARWPRRTSGPTGRCGSASEVGHECRAAHGAPGASPESVEVADDPAGIRPGGGESKASERTDYPTYLERLAERELIDRERRAAERRIQAARFPVTGTLDTFDFAAQPSINEPLVRQLVSG
jgi:hypothetical protein